MLTKLSGIITSRLSSTDIGFAALRIITFLGGLGWLIFSRLGPLDRYNIALILALFCTYSSLLYWFVLSWPKIIKRLYLAALILDLAFIYFLIRFTGGIESNFHLAFYLLVALHSFYYGMRLGLCVAIASSILYILSDMQGLSNLHWTDLTLRLSFLILIAVSLGLLSEKEHNDRIKIENLNRELESKRISLEKAYANLKEAQEQLLHTEKLASIGTLAAGVAHEINNPLDGIQNCIRTIIKEPGNHEQTLKYLRLAADGLTRIENIVRKLLDFARQSDLNMGHVNVKETILKALELVAHRMDEQVIILTQRFDKDMPQIWGDGHYLQQVFLNIILNALDAMPKGGNLTIIGRRDPSNVSISITDTGCGIPKENMERLFDPFFSTKGVGEGTGLGLSVGLGIIREHRGEISVESEINKGSTFTVTLPSPPHPASPARGEE